MTWKPPPSSTVGIVSIVEYSVWASGSARPGSGPAWFLTGCLPLKGRLPSLLQLLHYK